MLFDLRGKRRRMIQVVYAVLALLFAITFVGFGIGSDAAGGIFDALGLGGGGHTGSTSSGSPQFDEDIEQAEEQLAQNPRDKAALRELARVRFLAGQTSLEEDSETGQAVLTEDARAEYEEAVDAWQRYLDTKPKEPDADLASLMVQAYVQLNDAPGAIESQRIVVDESPSAGTLSNLAFYLYADGRIEEGEKIADRAIAEADPGQKQQFRQQLDQIAQQAKRAQRQQARQPPGGAGGEGALEQPFGGLGGGAGGAGAPPGG